MTSMYAAPALDMLLAGPSCVLHISPDKAHIIAAGAGEEQHSPHDSHGHSQSLSDGRMDVGTHLPLMAKRYAYLSLLGEGTSAQVDSHSCAISAASLRGNVT